MIVRGILATACVTLYLRGASLMYALLRESPSFEQTGPIAVGVAALWPIIPARLLRKRSHHG